MPAAGPASFETCPGTGLVAFASDWPTLSASPLAAPAFGVSRGIGKQITLSSGLVLRRSSSEAPVAQRRGPGYAGQPARGELQDRSVPIIRTVGIAWYTWHMPPA